DAGVEAEGEGPAEGVVALLGVEEVAEEEAHACPPVPQPLLDGEVEEGERGHLAAVDVPVGSDGAGDAGVAGPARGALHLEPGVEGEGWAGAERGGGARAVARHARPRRAEGVVPAERREEAVSDGTPPPPVRTRGLDSRPERAAAGVRH